MRWIDSTLPGEILSLIFRQVLDALAFEHRYLPNQWLMNITHSFRHWRNVALATPRLWADVFIRVGRRPTTPSMKAAWETWLSRSKSCPLWIHIQFDRPADIGHRVMRPLSNILLPHHHRCVRLSMNCNAIHLDDSDVITLFNGPPPNPFQPIQTPNFPVTSLDIGSESDGWGVDAIARCLKLCPNLETLTITGIWNDERLDEDDIDRPSPVALPFLNSLKLSGEYESIVAVSRVITACRLDLLEVNASSPNYMNGHDIAPTPILRLGVEPFPVTTLDISGHGLRSARLLSILREAPKVENLAISGVRSVARVINALMWDKSLVPLLKSLEFREVESPINSINNLKVCRDAWGIPIERVEAGQGTTVEFDELTPATILVLLKNLPPASIS